MNPLQVPAYSFAEVEAAMCAWEYIDRNNPNNTGARDKFYHADKWREDNGTCAMREACIRLSLWIEQVWIKFDDCTAVVFDWEFVPYLMDLVSWPDDGTWPTHPPADFTARLVRFRFDNSILRGEHVRRSDD
jgi:hypothetical protein